MNKNIIFIYQLTESLLKIIKFQTHTRTVLGTAIHPLGSGESLVKAFEKLGYAHNPIIVSLPRNQVTSRYLKVPTQSYDEIENIANLQAPRFLPYPTQELITGFEIVSTDKEGYAQINLVIAHKDVIERYLKIQEQLKPVKFELFLSSYGLVNFYNYLKPGDDQEVLLVNIDSGSIELAITLKRKLLFSRAFNFNPNGNEWKNLLIEEINRSRDTYLKESGMEAPVKISLTGGSKFKEEIRGILNRQGNLSIETISYPNAKLPEEYSFSHLLGFGLAKTSESLNLLPKDLKQGLRTNLRHKEEWQIASFILAIILIFGLSIVKVIDNQSRYLKRLQQELKKVGLEVKPLEEVEERIRISRGHSQSKPSALDILYELHRISPQAISLVNLSYEVDKEIILRGQAPELSVVLDFVAQLEKSSVLKKLNIKIRYATQKKIGAKEIVDFEIACLKK